jgi:membrane associated rhomboid family serine protease
MKRSLIQRPIPYRYYNVTIVLLVINIAVYMFGFLFPRLYTYLALTPYLVVKARAIWQIVTYMFVHSPRGIGHILFNMLALFLFGTQVERRLGSTEFLLYYMISGVGAGLATLAVNWYTGMALVPVVGASGAIFGLLLAYATLFPDSRLFIFGLLPLRAPVAVLLFTALELFFMITGTRSGVAHLTHLAGLLFGYMYFILRFGINPIKVFIRR